MNWLAHWGLHIDPFRPGAVPYQPTPGQEEAIARLLHGVANGDRRLELRGPAGLGKSIALNEALRRLRRPGLRICAVRYPADGFALLRGVGAGLGLRLGPTIGRAEAIARLVDAARLARAQGGALVFAVDDDALLDHPDDRRMIDLLDAVARQAGGRASVLVTGRGGRSLAEPGALRIRLDPMTRGEASRYLAGKLQAAGHAGDLPFDARAVARLHAIAEGRPGAVDRLAALAMRAGALARRDRVSAVEVEGVAREIEPVPGLAAAVDG